MAEIRHLENRHDVIIFLPEGGLIWIKFCRLTQNDMSTAVIWSKLKPEFHYGGRLSHCRVLPPGELNVMIPELRVTLHGAATWRIQ